MGPVTVRIVESAGFALWPWLWGLAGSRTLRRTPLDRSLPSAESRLRDRTEQ